MDILSAKQNARNKHKASQHKKRAHGGHGAKHGKSKNVVQNKRQSEGPQKTTLDQFVSLPSVTDPYLSIDDVSRIYDDPSSKNFLHLITSASSNFSYREERDLEYFEDGSGSFDHLKFLSRCIGSLPLSTQLDLLPEEDSSIINALKETEPKELITNQEENKEKYDYSALQAMINRTSTENKQEVSAVPIILSSQQNQPKNDTKIQEETNSVKLQDSDELLESELDDILAMDEPIALGSEKKIQTAEEPSAKSDEELEDWLDSVI